MKIHDVSMDGSNGAGGEPAQGQLAFHSGDSRDYTKDPIYIMDILELHAFKERMDALMGAKAVVRSEVR